MIDERTGKSYGAILEEIDAVSKHIIKDVLQSASCEIH
jgi:hypothetical protein